jgi:hypothetical protein
MADLWPTLHTTAAAAVTTKPETEDDDFGFFDDVGPIVTPVKTDACPICEDDSAIEEDGSEIVCTRCGTMLAIPLEQGAEYRWYSAESGGGPDPSRCSFPINHQMPESSLGTIMLAKNQSAQMRKISRYHTWNQMPYRERTLWSIFDSLQVRASNAGIGTASIEEAKELFAQLTASESCRGQLQRDSMLAACLWEGLKRHGTPRMPRDIAIMFQIPLKQVTKGIKQFQHLFAIRTSGMMTDTYANPATKKVAAATEKAEEPKEESAETIASRAFQRRAIWQKTASRTTSYEDFIKPFLTNLAAPRHMEAVVHHVCKRTEELDIVPENTPPSLTASVIAFCGQELGVRMEITEIARVCGISAVTIHKCLKRMTPHKEKLLEQ